MMSSLCARRVVVAARLVLAPRRTLFATPKSSFPPAKTPPAAAGGAPVEKEASKAKRATPGKAPKHPTGRQEKQTRISNKLKPPKSAPNPFFLFAVPFLKSQPKPNTLQEAQEIFKRAGEIWRGYSAAEKQPFYDEFEVRHAQAKQAREEFFKNMPSSDLKRLNAIRKVLGKPVYRTGDGPGGVASPFVYFFNEFRKSADGEALINEASPDKKYVTRASQAAADRWRSMSGEEKAPYFERSRKAREEFKAARADS